MDRGAWQAIVHEVAKSRGNGNPLQDSCLENSTDRRAWQATVHGVVARIVQPGPQDQDTGSQSPDTVILAKMASLKT